ncbi:MAG TPA: DegT/DnrJ/EryC1/StrS family aminotransferase [Phycisphaerae bacterium]|nr:DegT/DnrJ/EryC1/StrS family aminotransferase [Phycisphaerae bacterium]
MTDGHPPVAFVDLKAQYADVKDRIVAGISKLIDQGAFKGGPALEAFEKQLAGYTGAGFAVGCSDGTSALVLALLATGMKKGDGAILPANTFIATANAVVHAGGTPVLVDCDSETCLLDLNQVEDALKAGRAKFILPVHLYGNPCPMKELMALADRHGAVVIEDNAQAIGADVNGRKTGTFGAAAGISFYPAKNLGAFGQGGAVLTNDEQTARTVRMYVEQGEGGERYHHDVVGYNARLDTIQAFVLSVLLEKLDGFNARRLRAADWYAARLPADRIQRRTENATPVYHLFEYRCDDLDHRRRVADALKANQIGWGYHYPVPIHKQKAYPQFNRLSFPVAERLADQLLSLPMHPGLREEEVAWVCDVVAGA